MSTTNDQGAIVATSYGVSVYFNGEVYPVNRTHPSFHKIKELAKERRWAEIIPLLNVAKAANQWGQEAVKGNEDFTFDEGVVRYQGVAFPSIVSQKVLAMMSEGLPADPLLNFLRKLRLNPSATAQRELLLFCVANEFQIHEDGDIIAYKGVRDDYRDIHSGRFLNTVGTVNEMARHEVDDNRDRTCSYGFHFAALEYASMFSGNRKVMVLKLNPKDVVSIPSDYNDQKGRACRYEVVAELKTKTPEFREVYNDEAVHRMTTSGQPEEIEAFQCEECGEDIYSDYDHDEACSEHPNYEDDDWQCDCEPCRRARGEA